jgi:glycine cleavage system H protein
MTAILVIATIVVLLSIDAVVLAARRRRAPATVATPVRPMLEPRPPQGIFVDRAHSWVRITTEGTLRVGVDDFLAEAVGEIESVKTPARGTQVKRGEPLLRLLVKGKELVIPAPASGEVVAVNDHVLSEPWAISRDPYGVGWVVSLWTRDHHEAIAPLRIGSAAAAFLRQEVQRLADFLTPINSLTTVPVLADGGMPGKGVVGSLDEERWAAFQSEFVGGSHEGA